MQYFFNSRRICPPLSPHLPESSFCWKICTKIGQGPTIEGRSFERKAILVNPPLNVLIWKHPFCTTVDNTNTKQWNLKLEEKLRKNRLLDAQEEIYLMKKNDVSLVKL